jgi:hypothetical protein
VTGIGSLPFAEPAEATAFVAEHAPEVPFWSQLPCRGRDERPVAQALAGMGDLLRPSAGRDGYDADPSRLGELVDRLRFGPAELDEGCAAGFFAFERALKAGAFPEALALKGQIVGPLSLAWALRVEGKPVLHRPELLSALSVRVGRLAAWQVQRLRRFGVPVLLFVDEPALVWEVPDSDPEPGGQVLPVRGLPTVVAAVREAGARVGLHCCAGGALEALAAGDADVISFDAHASARPGPSSGEALWGGTGSDRVVAFGLVPRDPGTSSALQLFAGWLGAAATEPDPPARARRSMVTAGCGLGAGEPAAAASSFRLAAEVAGLIRSVAEARPAFPLHR